MLGNTDFSGRAHPRVRLKRGNPHNGFQMPIQIYLKSKARIGLFLVLIPAVLFDVIRKEPTANTKTTIPKNRYCTLRVHLVT